MQRDLLDDMVFPLPRYERGLPLPERLDSRPLSR